MSSPSLLYPKFTREQVHCVSVSVSVSVSVFLCVCANWIVLPSPPVGQHAHSYQISPTFPKHASLLAQS